MFEDFFNTLFDSDEEDSEYEEVMIPKKKQQAKQKRAPNEAASSKRIKPNPKPQFRVPKKIVPWAIPSNQAPKKRPQASIEPPGAPPSKAVQTEVLIHPFSKIIQEATNCILM